MASPNIKEAYTAGPGLIVLEFDAPLAEIATPVDSFTVNYGVLPVSSISYPSNSSVGLALGEAISSFQDKLFVSYVPPLDVDLLLRGVLPAGSSDIDKKIHSVKAFSRFAVRNTLEPSGDEDANLGESITQESYPAGGDPSQILEATPDDFVIAFGEREAIQLTNPEDASANSINMVKLRMAIVDANALIDNYIIQATRAGKFLVSSNRRRTALIIARYYLDVVRRREDVKEDYERCIKELEKNSQTPTGPDKPASETPRGAIRTHRIPQVFNRVTGKGLDGWHIFRDVDGRLK